MTFPLVVASACFAAGIDNPAALAVPEPVHRRAVALVEKLGDRQFSERDAAGKQLEALGRLALPAVRAGRRSPDAEVRKRCGQLAPVMETEELTARLRVFAADVAGRYDHAVPGWELFKAAAGDTRAARDLFAAITRDRANWPLLRALRGPGVDVHRELLALGGGPLVAADRPDPLVAAQAAAVRRWEFYNARNAPPPAGEDDEDNPKPRKPVRESLTDIALVMLAETLHAERLNTRRGVAEISMASLLNERTARDAMLGRGPLAPAFQSLGRVWLDTRDADGALIAYHQARALRVAGDELGGLAGPAAAYHRRVALGYDEPALDRYAARVLLRPNLPTDARVECAGRLGVAGDAAQLGPVLANFGDAEFAAGGQVRDAMLYAAVQMTRQTPLDYGLIPDRTPHWYAVPDGTRPAAMEAAIQKARAAAFERWRDWEATHFGAAAGPLGAVSRGLK